jgi:hypothetical protein
MPTIVEYRLMIVFSIGYRGVRMLPATPRRAVMNPTVPVASPNINGTTGEFASGIFTNKLAKVRPLTPKLQIMKTVAFVSSDRGKISSTIPADEIVLGLDLGTFCY